MSSEPVAVMQEKRRVLKRDKGPLQLRPTGQIQGQHEAVRDSDERRRVETDLRIVIENASTIGPNPKSREHDYRLGDYFLR
jgi:hypothetical protein